MSRGVVTEYLISLIAKQVDENSLVVWSDPGANYRAVAERLEIPGTTIAHYDGSFLSVLTESWTTCPPRSPLQ